MELLSSKEIESEQVVEIPDERGGFDCDRL